jgi:L-rhamnose mutarotase
MVCEAREGFDPARDYQRYAEDPRCFAWDELMRRYQRRAPVAGEGEWWAGMTEVFRLGNEE